MGQWSTIHSRHTQQHSSMTYHFQNCFITRVLRDICSNLISSPNKVYTHTHHHQTVISHPYLIPNPIRIKSPILRASEQPGTQLIAFVYGPAGNGINVWGRTHTPIHPFSMCDLIHSFNFVRYVPCFVLRWRINHQESKRYEPMCSKYDVSLYVYCF